jgi:hypothetical protein
MTRMRSEWLSSEWPGFHITRILARMILGNGEGYGLQERG